MSFSDRSRGRLACAGNRAPSCSAGFLATAFLSMFIATGASAQYYGHAYEHQHAPIRAGEQPVIPLDTKDPT
jgi:hypothetical protein